MIATISLLDGILFATREAGGIAVAKSRFHSLTLAWVSTLGATINVVAVEEMIANIQHSRFWREVAAAYGFAIVMFALAIIPGLNFTFSGHGGFSWLLIPLCFPYVASRAVIKIVGATEDRRRWYTAFYQVTIPSYVALALPLSWAATTSIHNTFGLSVSTWSFFGIMVSPIPWWYFG